MKFHLVLLVFVCICGVVFGASVSLDRARRVGVGQRNRVNSQRFHSMEKSGAIEQFSDDDIVETHVVKGDDGAAVYYVFNLRPAGWVIVSADDVARPIIAYSEEGSYSAREEDQPPAFKWWMDSAKLEISEAIAKKLSPLSETKTEWEQIEKGEIVWMGETITKAFTKALPSSVSPLVKTKWGQGFPVHLPFTYYYNDRCPYENWLGVQTFAVTGCVATAMAQVMKYHEWPMVGNMDKKYNTQYKCSWGSFGCTYGEQEVNFGETFYDWKNMPLNQASPATAELMYHCGVSVGMNYSRFVDKTLWEGSTSSLTAASTALQFYFRFNNNLKDRFYFSFNDWVVMVKENLSAGLPVIYAGKTPGSESGHAFVCDGYRDIVGGTEFHFNWGWDGGNDGYFTLDNLTPGSSNYNAGHIAIVDIEPFANDLVFVNADFSTVPVGTSFSVELGGVSQTFTYGVDAFRTISEGIATVNDGGTVIIYPSTQTYGENILIDKSVTLRGYTPKDLPSDFLPSINGRYNPGYPVIRVIAPGASVVLEKLEMYEGDGSYYNAVRRGAGLYVYNAKDVVVRDCFFHENKIGGASFGGGIYAQNTVVNVSGCRFWVNEAENGGGMAFVNCSGTVSNCMLDLNNSFNYGGGIYLEGSVTPLITDCVFKENDTNFGGGIFCSTDTIAEVRNCVFQNNTAYHRGGGMYNWTDSDVKITNCTFYGNAVTINPPKEGGAICGGGSDMIITNCILTNNIPDQIAGKAGNPGVNYCNIDQAGFGLSDGSFDGNGNINMAPMFADSGDGDFRLLEGSPCIDAGSNGAVPEAMESDMDGNERIVHGDCDGVEQVDMGVYEYVLTLPVGDSTGDCAVDYGDLLVMAESWLDTGCGDCMGADLDGSGYIGLRDMAILAENWLLY